MSSSEPAGASVRFLGARGASIDADAVRRAFLERGASMVQCVSPRCVFGPRHIYAAHAHLERRRKSSTLRARDPSMELLLCIACTDQIELALDRGGMRKGDAEVIVAWEGEVRLDGLLEGIGLERDDSLVSAAGKPLAILGIRDGARGDPEDRAVEMVNLAQL